MGNVKSKKEIVIKSIAISLDELFNLEEFILRSYKERKLIYPFKLYRKWSLAAYVLGFFTAAGDFESSGLFINCLMKAKTPRVKIRKDEDEMRIMVQMIDG